MKAEDLELLERLNWLDGGDMQDLDSLLNILLSQNAGPAFFGTDRTELHGLVRLFGWTRRELRDFLIGVRTELSSPALVIRTILATTDFCLMLWSFHHTHTLHVPARLPLPFTFYILAGTAQVFSAERGETAQLQISAGEVFQAGHSKDLQCRFEASTEALFYDFPAFQSARRNMRRLRRFRPVSYKDTARRP